MSATQAKVAFGIILKKGGAAIGDAYSDWGLEITNITAPGFTRAAIDATLIAAPSSTKNSKGERDPQMHQTKKGNQRHFGMKALQGLPAKSTVLAC